MKNRDLALQKGMILPTEEVCKKCHNPESPTYKPFNYAEASAKIAHPDPTLAKQGNLNIGQNIRWTLRDVPVKISPYFKPKRIHWIPSDGHDLLIKKTIKKLDKEIQNVK